MADNTVLPAGSGGDTIADEDIAGVKYPKVKLIDATATSTSPIGVAANPLKVSLANTAANATAIKVDNSAVTQPVSGTFWQATQPVSAASLPLPTGAATAAKQPALGTAGSSSTDVITVQGIASGTAQNVAQSGTWTVQPGNTANTTPWLVKNIAKSVSSQTALTTTATVSGAAGTFQGGSFMNLNSTPAYIQVFDTTGAVTLGTTTPTFVQSIPANATPANGAAYVFDIVGGIGITNGIKVAATTTATGATTVTTGLTGYIAYL